jgi:hypothetical protein
MQDAIDLEEHGIDRKQAMLDTKLKKIAEKGQSNQESDKPKEVDKGAIDHNIK